MAKSRENFKTYMYILENMKYQEKTEIIKFQKLQKEQYIYIYLYIISKTEKVENSEPQHINRR